MSASGDGKDADPRSTPTPSQTRLIHKYDSIAAALSHSKIQGLADSASKFASELTKERIAEYFAPVVAVTDAVLTAPRGQLGDHEDGKSVWSVKTGVTLKVRGGRGEEKEREEERKESLR